MVWPTLNLYLQPGDLGQAGRYSSLVLPAACLLMAWRSFRGGTLLVTSQLVVLRGIYRTRRIAVDSLRTVDVAVGRFGLLGYTNEYLRFFTIDGEVVEFKEFHSRRRRDPKRLSAVQQAAEFIGGLIRAG